MKRQHAAFIAIVVGALFATAPTHGQFPGRNPNLPAWKVGSVWNLEVVSYPRADTGGQKKSGSPKTGEQRFHMRVNVNAMEELGAMTCYRLFYVPGLDAPDEIRGHFYIVLHDGATGWPQRITRSTGDEIVAVERFSDAMFPANTPAYYPLELIPFVEKRTIAPKDIPTRMILDKTAKDGKTTYTATVMNGDVEEVRVRQTWIDGEPWWIESERFVNGKKELSVKRVSMSLFKQEQEEFRIRMAAKKAANAGAGTSASSPEYLRVDPRLQKPTPLVADNPKRALLIKMVEEASGLKLTVAANLTNDAPLYGGIQYAGAKAWLLMELMVDERFLNNGRWVRVGDEGYRLEGETKPEARDPAAPVPETPEQRAERTSPLRWVATGFVLGALVVISVGLLILRYRAARHKKAAAAAVPATGAAPGSEAKVG